MSDVAAGWYEDPQVAGQQRYWDGAAWTDEVAPLLLFDGMLNLIKAIGKEEQRLVVSPAEVWWGEEYARWDDVIAFRQLTTMMSGLPYFHEVFLQLEDREMHIRFMARVKRDPIGDRAHAILIERLQQTLGVRVLTTLMQMLERGEPIRLSGLLLGPQGFASEKMSEQLIPWPEFGGMEIRSNNGIYVDLFRLKSDGKRKRAFTVPTDMLRTWVLPPLVEEHSRRYGAG